MDQPRVQRQGVVGSQTQPFNGSGGEILHEDVRLGDQFFQDAEAVVGFKIQDNAFLAAVEPDEVAGHPARFVVVAAGEVAGVPLDLDDPGAEVRELPGGERSGNGLLQGNNGDAFEGQLSHSKILSLPAAGSAWRVP